MGDVIILRGLPGSGKSTLAKLFAGEKGDSIICCADDFFEKDGEYRFDPSLIGEAHSECQSKFEDLLFGGEDMVIVANTSTTQKELNPYYMRAEAHGYRVHTLVVENRHGKESTHGVPVSHMERMRDRFQVVLSLSEREDHEEE